MMAEIMGSLPMGVATIVLDFAATETMLFLRELSQPFKRASEGCCFNSTFRLENLLQRAHHLVEVTPTLADDAELAELSSHFTKESGRCLAFSRKSTNLLNALSQLRAVDCLMRVRLKWNSIDTAEKVDKYLDSRLCRTKGFWNSGPGRDVYSETEKATLPALFSACRWLLRGLVTAPAPRAICFYHAFVDTMGADGMGADGLPIQIPLLCWEPASN
ncbi:unnamed protein product [Durusdinium trenchii]|uniref:Uncharacterized protein n=1 Tax=Durusdinium trenchii TaxID=1381693 RepID=A0ABP0QID7_9DINO